MAALPHREGRPDFRMEPIRPRGLHEDVSTMRVARLRDGTASFARTNRMFARHKPELRHQFARGVKAPPIDQLRGQHHRAMHLEPAEALQHLDGRRVRRRQRELRDVLIQRVAPRQFVFEQREVFPDDEAVLGRKR